MSSNIKIRRVCLRCHNDFIAKTTVTKFCSLQCNRKYYREVAKADKINLSELETIENKKAIKVVTIAKEFLSVRESAMCVCVLNIYFTKTFNLF